MVVGELAEPVDLAVIGGGIGGYTAAVRAAELGRQVVLVDTGGESGLGGVCLNEGCIPSKSLIELAHQTHLARTEAISGLRVGDIQVDLAAFQDDKNQDLAGLRRAVLKLLEGGGVEIVQGTARFSAPTRLAVERPALPVRYLEFQQAVVAVGSDSCAPSTLALDGVRVMDAAALLELTEVPESVAVVGAGPTGIELGTALAKLGADVVLIETESQVLPELDAGLVGPVRRRLAELKVEVLTDAAVAGLESERLRIETEAGPGEVAADVVLVATGRRPRTSELGLAHVGVSLAAGGLIDVDASCLAAERVAAVGDVIAGPALAHKAIAEANVAAEALTGRYATRPSTVPLIIFSDPELASVGLTRRQAQQAGIDAVSKKLPHRACGRAVTIGQTGGFTEIVVDVTQDRVIGVHLAGPHASELIAEGALAIEMEASPADLALTIHPHPTLSETLSDASRDALREAAKAVI